MLFNGAACKTHACAAKSYEEATKSARKSDGLSNKERAWKMWDDRSSHIYIYIYVYIYEIYIPAYSTMSQSMHVSGISSFLTEVVGTLFLDRPLSSCRWKRKY